MTTAAVTAQQQMQPLPKQRCCLRDVSRREGWNFAGSGARVGLGFCALLVSPTRVYWFESSSQPDVRLWLPSHVSVVVVCVAWSSHAYMHVYLLVHTTCLPPLVMHAGGAPQSGLSQSTCSLPFRYGSTTRTDCVAPMPPIPTTTSTTVPSSSSSSRLYCPLSVGDDSSSASASAAQQFVSTAGMSVCSSSAAFTAATQDTDTETQGAALSASGSSSTTTTTSGSSIPGFMGDPTAPVPGLPDSKTTLLAGLASTTGSGARRYSMHSKRACQPLPAPALQLGVLPSTAGSSTNNNRVTRNPSGSFDAGGGAGLGRRGGRGGSGAGSSVDGASASASPAAGVASCVVNAERGRFECVTAIATTDASAGSRSSSSGRVGSASNVMQPEAAEVCAPVVRTTISCSSCYLPFMWQGFLRDDCVWHNGMEVCPVLASAAEGAGGGGGVSAAGSKSSGSGIPPVPATNALDWLSGAGTAAAVGAAAAVGPWRWEQCSRDYVTKWDQPQPVGQQQQLPVQR